MYLLGYDIGSSSIKAALVNADTGLCVASDYFPKTEASIKSLSIGWAEQDPDSWWNYLVAATRAVLDQSGINPCDVRAIGISYQMHGLVMLDKTLQPIRDAIIWCDSRGVPYGHKAFNELGHYTCLSHILNSPGNFTATKLAWVRDNEPETFERMYKIALPGDYIALKLTGTLFTTASGLSEMMLWDFSTDSPALFMMDYLGLPYDILPEIVPTFSIQGNLSAVASDLLGLPAGIPVSYRAGDQPNNALSLNVFAPGEIASTAGTSGVVYGINGSTAYDTKSRVNCFAHVNHTAVAPRVGVMTCINGTGILNSWMRRNVAAEGLTYDDMNAIASTVPIGADGVSILPFGNGAERVLSNSEIGCSVIGLDFNHHDRRHLLRAAQEGIVFSFMYGIEIMEEMGMTIDKIHAGHANMFLSPLFRKTLASVSGATIELYDTDGAIGAAKGAGIGADLYRNHNEAFDTLKLIDTILPVDDPTPYLEAYSIWKQRLETQLVGASAYTEGYGSWKRRTELQTAN